jgi:Ca2+-transporting ATPase
MTLHKAPVIVISHLILQNLLALSCFSYTCFPTIFLGHSKTRNRNHNRWGHQKFVHGTTTIGKSNHQVVASLQDEATSLFNKIANQEENISSEKDKNKQEDEFSFHLSSTESIMEELDISRSINEHIQLGLTNEEASKRLEIYGMNLIPSPPRKTWTDLFLDQFDDRLVQILLFVAGLSTFSSISEIISSSMGNIARDSEINIFQSLVEPGIILLILVLNAAVGVWQQLSAFDSMDALEKLQPYLATVLRRAGNAQYSTSNTVKGEWVSGYSASELVPGDIVKMKTGDMVPADVKIIILNSSVFSVNESYLTGESVAVQKVIDFGDVKTQMQHETKVPISDQRDMAFSGTMVTQGSAIALVVRTGGKTEMGKIQGSIISVEDIKTPLGIKLDDFGDDLALIIAFICAAVWFVSIPNFSDPSFSTSYDGALYYAKVGVALGVAAIPEGLPAVVTLVLSLGTRRLAERNVIVRKLPSVETLGCVSVICSDKTGTLTTNQMTAVRIVTLDDSTGKGLEFVENSVNGTSYKPVGKVDGIDNDEIIRFPTGALADILSISFGCNDAELIEKDGDYIVVGEPTEGALICLAEKLGEINYENRPYTVDAANKKVWEKSWERYATLEFDRERKSMSVLCREARDSLEQNSIPNEVTHRLLVKGAPNLLLERCSRIKLRDGKTMDLTPDLKEELRLTISSLSQRPLRCLLLAVKEISGGLTEEVPLHNLLHDPTNFEEIESDLTVVGIVGIKDPARLDAKKSIEMCKDAGIRVIMISGDAKETTTAIAQELNILSEDEVNCTFTGREFFSKSESEQTSLISSGNIVFCRTEPLDKQQIVKILQSMDEIPAMTGDGVNDAPALRQASIGVAMGSGSDVAKEAADMILVDDSFSTIVSQNCLDMM